VLNLTDAGTSSKVKPKLPTANCYSEMPDLKMELHPKYTQNCQLKNCQLPTHKKKSKQHN